MFMEKEKETEQVKSTIRRLVELLESNGYWVWSISIAYESSGLIT
jgi:hypothetical protein